MLSMLSGREHRVVSGLCVTNGKKTVKRASVTYVSFREITESELEAYLATGECDDKAGAYGIQGFGGLFVKGIRGDWYTVVGMPLSELYGILRNEFSFDFFAVQDGEKS